MAKSKMESHSKAQGTHQGVSLQGQEEYLIKRETAQRWNKKAPLKPGIHQGKHLNTATPRHLAGRGHRGA